MCTRDHTMTKCYFHAYMLHITCVDGVLYSIKQREKVLYKQFQGPSGWRSVGGGVLWGVLEGT